MKTTLIPEINTRVTRFGSLHEFLTHTDRSVSDIPGDEYHCDNRDELRILEQPGYDGWRFGSGKNLEEFMRDRLDPKIGKDLCKYELGRKINSKEYKQLLQLALTYRKKIKFLDVGNRISVPHAIAGDDKYFIQMKTASKPTVKICINVGGSASVDPEDLVKVATSAVPIIYMLETAGISTEIYGGAFVTRLYERDPENITHDVFEFPMKSAQQRFNWTTFAPLFTPGTFRYNFFRAFLMNKLEADSGLGRPMEEGYINRYANNQNYAAIIGINKPGTFDTVREIFKTIK